MLKATLASPGPMGREGRWLLVRFVSALIAAALFFACARRAGGADEAVAIAATAVLALELVMTFSRPEELPWDFGDVAFMAAFTWLSVRERRWELLALAAVAASNRESALFAAIIWFCVVVGRDRQRW